MIREKGRRQRTRSLLPPAREVVVTVTVKVTVISWFWDSSPLPLSIMLPESIGLSSLKYPTSLVSPSLNVGVDRWNAWAACSSSPPAQLFSRSFWETYLHVHLLHIYPLMETIRIPILFGGQWIEKNEQYCFTGKSVRGLELKPPVAYHEFIHKVAGSIGVNELDNDITLQYQLMASVSLPPLTITSDKDVDFFIAKSSAIPHKSPLYVTYSPMVNVPDRVDTSAANSVHEHPRMNIWKESLDFADCVPSSYPAVNDQRANDVVKEDGNPEDLFSDPLLPDMQPIRETISHEFDIQLNSSPTQIRGQSPVISEEAGVDAVNVNESVEPIFNDYMPRLNAFATGSTFAACSGVQSLETIRINERVTDSSGFVIGELLESKEALQTRLSMYALTNNFQNSLGVNYSNSKF